MPNVSTASLVTGGELDAAYADLLARIAVNPVQDEAILSAGQSPESGRGEMPSPLTPDSSVQMFGNDYVFKTAVEPIDSNVGQIDAVSNDGQNLHGSTLQLALSLRAARGGKYTIVPAAKGGTSTAQWLPGSNVYDRATLFGSALYRFQVVLSSGRVRRMLTWAQGETDGDGNVSAATYTANTQAIWGGFRTHLGFLPILFSQMSGTGAAGSAPRYHAIREAQRQLEDLGGTAASQTTSLAPQAYMVVTHDLPMNADALHTTLAGQLETGKRRALLALERIYRVPGVDGTGPRLVSITKPSSTTVKVKTTQVLASGLSNADGYWTATDGGASGAALTISSVVRDPGDSTAALITFSTAPVGTVTLLYGPPATRPTGTWAINVVRAAAVQSGLTYGLPLPSFTGMV